MTKGTNAIETLLAKHCPDGVEYRELGEIAEIDTGSSNRKDESKSGMYPLYVRSKNILKSDTFQFDEVAIIIPGEGGIGNIFHYVDGKYALHQRAYRIHVTLDILNAKFLYYFMFSSFKQYISTKSVGTTSVSIRKPMLEKFTIPIPPLVVQEYIVGVLDTFTELEAELEARVAQYKHYREKLLTFGDDVEYRELGEIGTFYGGLTNKTAKDFLHGNAKYITYKNIFNNMAVNTNIDSTVRIHEHEKQNQIRYGDCLFTGSSETPYEAGMSSVLTTHPKESLYLNSFCFGYRLNNSSLFLPEFLKHLLRAYEFRKKVFKTGNGVTRFNISKKLFAKLTIPIPPLPVQERIVSLLDKFDALVNDISIGLPAELKARRAQYEYYRNTLLRFQRISQVGQGEKKEL